MNLGLRQNLFNNVFKPVYGIRSDGIAYAALANNINSSSGAFEFEFTALSTEDTSVHIFGAHGSTAGAHFLLHHESLNKSAVYCFGQYADYNDNLIFALNTRTSLSVSRRNNLMYVLLNGNSIGRTMWSSSINNNPFLIFRANDNTTVIKPATTISASNIIFHKLKVWFEEKLVADLIPCKKSSNNELCFFNMVDKSFIKNIAGNNSKFIEVTK